MTRTPMTEGHIKKGGVNPAPTTPKPQIRPPAQRPALPRKLKFLASAIDESKPQIKKIIKKAMDELSSRMISADEYEYTSGDIHRKFIDSLRKDVKRLNLENANLNRLMPHTGETCKHQGTTCRHLNVNYFCKHPDEAEMFYCTTEKCPNDKWELND